MISKHNGAKSFRRNDVLRKKKKRLITEAGWVINPSVGLFVHVRLAKFQGEQLRLHPRPQHYHRTSHSLDCKAPRNAFPRRVNSLIGLIQKISAIAWTYSGRDIDACRQNLPLVRCCLKHVCVHMSNLPHRKT